VLLVRALPTTDDARVSAEVATRGLVRRPLGSAVGARRGFTICVSEGDDPSRRSASGPRWRTPLPRSPSALNKEEQVRHREVDPPRSFWRVVVIPDDGADLTYIADRVANLAGVDSVIIEEHPITDLWQEPDNGGGGTGG